MGEYIPASIQIGGRIKREDAEHLIALIADKGLRTTGPEEDPTLENLGEEFYDGQINYGNLDEIETLCQSAGLFYRHWFDSGCEWEAATVFYDPILGKAFEARGGNGSGFALTESEILALGSMDAVKRHFELMRSPLPKLEIVDA